MGKSFRKSAKSTAGHILVVIGLGGLLNGVYRLKKIPQKVNSPGRRERRALMRKALVEAANDPQYVAAMEEETRSMDGAVGDGLSGL